MPSDQLGVVALAFQRLFGQMLTALDDTVGIIIVIELPQNLAVGLAFAGDARFFGTLVARQGKTD
ncbi:hypothetical protein KVG95_21380 [Pseudomonas sp. SWRI79]|uniref:Uncharacterized protein n=1 Tax=Pseudomonas farris TaxID=2841207 RepID=A0ABS6PZS9_9PSED|nr:hypothetical protein [Pseudomonas farris]MBV4465884.1 hypothetical protein [Pseudomonas farris]